MYVYIYICMYVYIYTYTYLIDLKCTKHRNPPVVVFVQRKWYLAVNESGISRQREIRLNDFRRGTVSSTPFDDHQPTKKMDNWPMKNGVLMGFNGVLMGFNGDSMAFNGN